MIHLLCIDTSSTLACGVALVQDHPENVIMEVAIPNGRTQGEYLAPALAKMLQEKKIAVQDLSGIAVAVGPGSFTGIRIGLATAQGLALPYTTPLLGISSLAALAVNARSWATKKSPNARVCTLFDARKGEVYAACYRFENQLPVPLIEETHCRPETWVDCLLQTCSGHEEILFLGEGSQVYQKIITDRLAKQLTLEFWVQGEPAHPCARNLARLAWENLLLKKFAPPALIQPRYLRPVDQEFKPA